MEGFEKGGEGDAEEVHEMRVSSYLRVSSLVSRKLRKGSAAIMFNSSNHRQRKLMVPFSLSLQFSFFLSLYSPLFRGSGF